MGQRPNHRQRRDDAGRLSYGQFYNPMDGDCEITDSGVLRLRHVQRRQAPRRRDAVHQKRYLYSKAFEKYDAEMQQTGKAKLYAGMRGYGCAADDVIMEAKMRWIILFLSGGSPLL